MPNEFLRWGDANNIPAQMNDFYHNYLSLDSELVCRTTEVRNHIESNFNLVKQVDITLDVFLQELVKYKSVQEALLLILGKACILMVYP